MAAIVRPERTYLRQSSQALPLAVEITLLILSVSLSWFLSAIFINPGWSLIALANYLWMCTLLFRIEPRATVLILPEIVSRGSSVIALIFIEYGSQIPELGTVGTPGSSSSSFLFFTLLFFAVYAAMFRLLAGPEGRLKGSLINRVADRFANLIAVGFLSIVGLLCLWLIYRGLSGGFPLISGMDRFAYRRNTDTVTLYILNLKLVLMFVLGMITFRLPIWWIYRFCAAGMALLLLILYFLFADKFFTQLAGMAGFFIPFLYIHHAKIRRFFAVYMFGAFAALGLVFSVTWFIYSGGGSQSPAATMDRLSGRIVGQGELWYLQNRIGAPLINWDGDFMRRNYTALRVKDSDLFAVQESLGANYFSNRYAPNRIRLSMRANQGTVTYTAALEAVGLAVFGWLGLGILMTLAGVGLAMTQLYVAYAIVARSMISALFANYILIQFRKTLGQFAPWVIFSIFSMKWLAVIAALELGIYFLSFTQRRAFMQTMRTGTR